MAMFFCSDESVFYRKLRFGGSKKTCVCCLISAVISAIVNWVFLFTCLVFHTGYGFCWPALWQPPEQLPSCWSIYWKVWMCWIRLNIHACDSRKWLTPHPTPHAQWVYPGKKLISKIVRQELINTLVQYVFSKPLEDWIFGLNI